MKPRFKTDRGPATKPALFITSLGGVKAVFTNPMAWGVDPCLGCFPWPHRTEEQGASAELSSGPPPSLWTAKGGPVAAEMNRPADSKPTTGVFAAPLGGTTTPTTTAPTSSGQASTQPVVAPTTTAPTTPTCPAGQVYRMGRCVYTFGA